MRIGRPLVIVLVTIGNGVLTETRTSSANAHLNPALPFGLLAGASAATGSPAAVSERCSGDARARWIHARRATRSNTLVALKCD